MYYVLRCLPLLNENGEALREIHNCFDVGSVWTGRGDGQPLTTEEKSFHVPIEVDYEPFRGYSGPPIEMRDVCVPIMSARLAEAITGRGRRQHRVFPGAPAEYRDRRKLRLSCLQDRRSGGRGDPLEVRVDELRRQAGCGRQLRAAQDERVRECRCSGWRRTSRPWWRTSACVG